MAVKVNLNYYYLIVITNYFANPDFVN